MMVSNDRMIVFHRGMNVIALTVAVLLSCNDFFVLKIPVIAIILSVSLIYVLLWLISYNRRNLYVIPSGAILCVFLFSLIQQKNMIQYIIDIVLWFIQYEKGKGDYQIAYAFFITLLFAVLITLFLSIFLKKQILRYILAAGFLLSLILFPIGEMELDKVPLAIFLFFIVQEIIELCSKLSDKNRNEHLTAIDYLFPICFLIGILAVSIPAKAKPIEWKFVKQAVHFLGDKIDDAAFYLTSLKENNDYEVAFSGYSDEENGFFNSVGNNGERVILKVSHSLKKSNCMYLIGNVRDKYTWKGWKKTKINYGTENDPMFDFRQMLYGFYLYNIRPQESEILLKNCRAEITYHKIKTKSVFYPLKTYQLESDTISYDSTSPNLYGDKLMKRGAAYEISYYEINYESDTIKNYLRKISRTDGSGKQPVNQSFNNDEFRRYLEEILYNHYLENYPMEDNFIEKMREHMKLIKNEFTKLPVVSDRVRNLAKEITKSHDNDYDKLKAIERYLSAYTYTLSPPKPEKAEDTIESFLFENKKGYCTYFATAMAVLGRCVGIPIRYVEGLVVNYDDYDGENYLVKNSASHAWAEAYMEGFGWVPFEPTPGRYHERFYTWEDRKTVSTVSDSSPHKWKSILNEQAEENKKIIHLEKMKQTRYMFYICMIILGGFAGLPVIYIFILKYGKKNRFLRAASNEKAKYLLRDILKFLKMDGYELISGETLYDYGKRINHRPDFDEITLERVFTLYNNIRYSKNEIKPEDIDSMILYYNCLKKKMIKKSKWNDKVKIYFSTIAYK